MIVSHKNRFIYLRAAKTASTSLHVALASHCGPNDIVTGGTGYFPHDKRYDEDEYVLKAQHSAGLPTHMGPAQARKRFHDVWHQYFKFVCVRNPWDLMVSMYFWAHRGPRRNNDRPPVLFKEFLKWHLTGSCPANKGMWLLDGKPWADFIIRFENLKEDIEELSAMLGLPLGNLPRLLTKVRPGDFHYSVLYDSESVQLVRKIYEPEIEAFGYTFDHVFAYKQEQRHAGCQDEEG